MHLLRNLVKRLQLEPPGLFAGAVLVVLLDVDAVVRVVGPVEPRDHGEVEERVLGELVGGIL